MRKIQVFSDQIIFGKKIKAYGEEEVYSSRKILVSMKAFLDRYPHEVFRLLINVRVRVFFTKGVIKDYVYKKHYTLSYGCIRNSTIEYTRDWQGQTPFEDLRKCTKSILGAHKGLHEKILFSFSIVVVV